MKKSKILIPVLSVAGLGAAITPMVAMTSCNKNKTTEISISFNEEFSAKGTQAYTSAKRSWEPGKYSAKFNYEGNKFSGTRVKIGYEGMGTLQKENLSIKIDGNVVDKSKMSDPAPLIVLSDFDSTSNHSIELTWSIDGSLSDIYFVFMQGE